jgi:hypothetical protein
VRIAHHHHDVSYVVLSTIATMVPQRPAMFRPYLKDFFVFSSDPVSRRPRARFLTR